MNPRSGTVLVLSGKIAPLREFVRRETSVPVDRIVSCSEKEITQARFILSALRDGHPNVAAFGCKDMNLQRYQFFLKLYLLLSGAQQRLIVDERGVCNRVRLFSFLLIDLPKFIVEITASCFVVIRAYANLLRLRSPRRIRERSAL